MALLFVDGMGHYDSTQIGEKYTTANTDAATTLAVATDGRFHNCLTRSCVFTGNLNNTYGYVEVAPLLTQTGPWTPTASGVCGFAFKVNDLSRIGARTDDGAVTPRTLWTCYEGQAPILHVTLNPNGTLTAWRHEFRAFSTVPINLGSSIQGLQADTWTYIELAWLIDATAGYVDIHIDGVQVLRFDGQTLPVDILVGYTGVWNAVRFLQVPPASLTLPLLLHFGDLYLADLDGGAEEVNDFLGDVIIDQIVPDGVGAYSGWSPNTAVNWDAVEEVPPDGDTTYVSAQTTGTRDSYTLEDVPLTSTILGYQTLIYARKDTEGGAMISPTLRLGGVDYDATAQGLGSPASYQYLIQPYDTNPATALRITPAEINAAEGGILKAV